FVGEDVDVVVSASNSAELRPRFVAEPFPHVTRQSFPSRRLEQWMIDRRIIGAILSADTERDDVLDCVRYLIDTLGKARSSANGEVRANRRIATGDVEANPDNGYPFAIGCDTTDRHHVAEVAVRHQGGALRTARHVRQLSEGFWFVIAEDGGLAHMSTD